MFASPLNYFSFLIPLFLLLVTCILLFWGYYKKLVAYMMWLNLGIINIALVQLIQTIIAPSDIYNYVIFSAFFFFCSIACITHAIYLRLGIQTRWTVVISSIFMAEILLSYFAFYRPSIDARLAIVATTSIVIGLNHISALYPLRSSQLLDRLLKLNLYSVLFVIGLRAVYLIVLYDQRLWIEQRDLIWASTQFLMLFFIMSMVAIFISCSVNDTLKRLHRERNLDPLTGLLNRRALDERLSGFTYRKSRYQHAILLCDIDYFKQVNDQYGHAIGDLALQHVAQLISQHLRKYDEVARIGGEEFQVLLLDVPRQTALCVAERIRLAIQNTPLMIHAQPLHLSISIGVSYFHSLEDYPTALEDADLLLYQAKKFGRNNIQWEFLSAPMPEHICNIQAKINQQQ